MRGSGYFKNHKKNSWKNKPDIKLIIEQEGIELKRGKALCPFHSERTPSFMVNRNKQTFHCWGCGEHGDVISFIMKLKGISFEDALIYVGIKKAASLLKLIRQSRGKRKSSVIMKRQSIIFTKNFAGNPANCTKSEYK